MVGSAVAILDVDGTLHPRSIGLALIEQMQRRDIGDQAHIAALWSTIKQFRRDEIDFPFGNWARFENLENDEDFLLLEVRLPDRVEAAVASVNYLSVGTLEFLFERTAEGRPNFYFMEMNPRIQVEHTVTEMVSGVDLIREQIRIAAGEKLDFSALRAKKPLGGHAIEVRINAEDPVTFAPSPGRITALHIPGGLGVRVDTHIYQGYVVPPNYDSLLAKLIAFGEDRACAIARLRRALDEFTVEGIKTNLDFHRRLVRTEDFLRGRLDTRFIERMK